MAQVMDFASLSSEDLALTVFAPEEPTFPRFNDLPAEIRIKIWKMAMVPRIVLMQQKELRGWEKRYKLRYSSKRAENNLYLMAIGRLTFENGDKLNWIRMPYHTKWKEISYYVATGIRPGIPNPGMISACRESYEIARKHYVKAFSSRFMGVTESIPESWIDVKNDTFYIRWDTFGYRCFSSPGRGISQFTYGALAIRDEYNMQNVENLALVADPKEWRLTYAHLLRMFGSPYCSRTFPGIKRLTFIITRPGCDIWSLFFLVVRWSRSVPGVKSWTPHAVYDFCPPDDHVSGGEYYKRPRRASWEEIPGVDHWEGKITDEVLEFWKKELLSINKERMQKGGDLYVKAPSKLKCKIQKGKEAMGKVISEIKYRIERI